MTNAEMLADLRTKLDEAAEGYWKDVECYRALSGGQTVVVDYLLKTFDRDNLNPILESLIKSVADSSYTGGTINLPSDYLRLLNVDYSYNGSGKASCIIAEIGSEEYYLFKENTYLQPEEGTPHAYVSGSNLNLLPSVSGTGSYEYNYISKAPDIDASTNPTLLSTTHPAIVQYAFSDLLKKKEINNAQALNEFYSMVKLL